MVWHPLVRARWPSPANQNKTSQKSEFEPDWPQNGKIGQSGFNFDFDFSEFDFVSAREARSLPNCLVMRYSNCMEVLSVCGRTGNNRSRCQRE